MHRRILRRSALILAAALNVTSAQSSETASVKPRAPADVSLMINIDFFDHLSEPQVYGVPYFGPDEVAALLDRCTGAGAGMVTWRAVCQVANYYTAHNYHLGEVPRIRSYPDARRRSGVFAAKVGVGTVGTGGIWQTVTNASGPLTLIAWVAADAFAPVRLEACDARDGALLAVQALPASPVDRGLRTRSGEDFVELRMEFTTDGPVRVGIVGDRWSDGRMNLFVVDDVSLTDAAGAELLRNGDMEDIKALQPVAWDLTMPNFVTLNGHVGALPEERFKQLFPAPGYARAAIGPRSARLTRDRARALEAYDPLPVGIREAHKRGLKFYAWLDPLDEGRREVPGTGSWWVSRFWEDHPECRLRDRDGTTHWGQMCFGYKAVREHYNNILRELMAHGADGIYIKTAFQHCVVMDGNPHDVLRFVYNDVALEAYDRRWAEPPNGQYDEDRLRVVYGDFFEDWLREAGALVRSLGGELMVSARPRMTLDSNRWPIDWGALIHERAMDLFLLEPRRNGPVAGLLESYESGFGYVRRCRAVGIRLGFDIYINQLGYTEHMKNLGPYLTGEIETVANWPVNFVGIYEALHCDFKGWEACWPALAEGRRRMAAIPAGRYERFTVRPPDDTGPNLALELGGARATIEVGGATRNARSLLDGIKSDDGGIQFRGAPARITVELPRVRDVTAVRLYPGHVAFSAFPSGECGLRRYRLEGGLDDAWFELVPPVTNAPTAKAMDALSAFDYVLHHAVDPPRRLDAVRLTVVEGSDTGKRVGHGDQVVTPPEERIVYLREIEVLSNEDIADDNQRTH
jgi:hypothetical protein